jgi:hypothetical protein
MAQDGGLTEQGDLVRRILLAVPRDIGATLLRDEATGAEGVLLISNSGTRYVLSIAPLDALGGAA